MLVKLKQPTRTLRNTLEYKELQLVANLDELHDFTRTQSLWLCLLSQLRAGDEDGPAIRQLVDRAARGRRLNV